MREEKDKRRRPALTGLIILVLAFIWGNSLLSPEASWAVSEAVKAVLLALLPGGGSGGGGEGAGLLGVLVRKAAHFTEFALLGALLTARQRGLPGARTLPPLAALLAALADETIQYFTGRTSSVFDVWLDFAGAAVGIIFVRGFTALTERKNNRTDVP